MGSNAQKLYFLNSKALYGKNKHLTEATKQGLPK